VVLAQILNDLDENFHKETIKPSGDFIESRVKAAEKAYTVGIRS
jgi:hypothetical protein